MEENIQNPTPQVVEETPKKKGKGCLVALVVVLVIFGLIGGGIYWGYRKITTMSFQKDLGVAYTQEDFDTLWSELGTEIDPSIACLDCAPLTYTDHQEVSTTVSNSQASAVVDIINENLEYGSISNSQVRFNDDGSAELSTTFFFEGQSFPVYLDGSFGKESESSVFGNISNIKVGGISLPSNFVDMVTNALVEIANTRIQEAGVRIDNIEYSSEGLDLKGLIPTKAY